MTPVDRTTKLVVNDFSKDHWSLLAYVETCVVDHQVAPGVGKLNPDRMRCNSNVHPLLVGPQVAMAGLSWNASNGTRLSGYWTSDGKTDPSRRIDWHDDYDCLNDLEDAGFVTVSSLVNGFVGMTPSGMRMAGLLRQHKAAGGQFATFKSVAA